LAVATAERERIIDERAEFAVVIDVDLVRAVFGEPTACDHVEIPFALKSRSISSQSEYE